MRGVLEHTVTTLVHSSPGLFFPPREDYDKNGTTKPNHDDADDNDNDKTVFGFFQRQ